MLKPFSISCTEVTAVPTYLIDAKRSNVTTKITRKRKKSAGLPSN